MRAQYATALAAVGDPRELPEPSPRPRGFAVAVFRRLAGAIHDVRGQSGIGNVHRDGEPLLAGSLADLISGYVVSFCIVPLCALRGLASIPAP